MVHNKTIMGSKHVFVLILCLVSSVCAKVKLGVIIDYNDTVYADHLSSVVKFAVSVMNAELAIFPASVQLFEQRVMNVDEAIESSCNLLNSAVDLVAGPADTFLVERTHGIFGGVGVPQLAPTVTAQLFSNPTAFPYLIRLSPTSSVMGQATAAYVTRQGWNVVTILSTNTQYGYSGSFALTQELEAGRTTVFGPYFINVVGNDILSNIPNALQTIKDSSFRIIILHCENRFIDQILLQAESMGMTSEQFGWVMTDFEQSLLPNPPPQRYLGMIGLSFAAQDGYDYDSFNTGWLARNKTAYPGADALSITELKYVDAVYAAGRLEAYLHTWGFMMVGATAKCYQTGINTDGPMLMGILGTLDVDGVTTRLKLSNNIISEQKVNVINLNADTKMFTKLSSWLSGGGISLTGMKPVFKGQKQTVLDKANPLEGKHLVGLLSTQQPFVMMKKGSPNNPNNIKSSELEGVAIDLLNELAKELKFTWSAKMPKSADLGYRIVTTDNFTDQLGELQAKEADLIIGSTFGSEELANYFTCSAAWWRTVNTFILKGEPTKGLWEFIEPIEVRMWWMAGVAMFAASFLVGFLTKCSPYDHHGGWVQTYHDIPRISSTKALRKGFMREKKIVTREFNWNNSLFFIWASLLQQGYHLYPASMSARIVSVVWWFFVILFISSYTAQQAARFTAAKLAGNIDTFAQLIGDPSFIYATDTASSAYKIINSTSEVETYEKMKIMWLKKPYHTIIKPAEGAALARKGNFAYVYDTTTLETYVGQQPCNLRLAPDSFGSASYVFIMQPDSPYQEMFSEVILQLKDQGLVDQFIGKWRKELWECPVAPEYANLAIGAVKYNELSGIFILVLASMPIGLCILCCECCASFKTVPAKHQHEAFAYRSRRMKRDLVMNYVPKDLTVRYADKSHLIQDVLSMHNQRNAGAKKNATGPQGVQVPPVPVGQVPQQQSASNMLYDGHVDPSYMPQPSFGPSQTNAFSQHGFAPEMIPQNPNYRM